MLVSVARSEAVPHLPLLLQRLQGAAAGASRGAVCPRVPWEPHLGSQSWRIPSRIPSMGPPRTSRIMLCSSLRSLEPTMVKYHRDLPLSLTHPDSSRATRKLAAGQLFKLLERLPAYNLLISRPFIPGSRPNLDQIGQIGSIEAILVVCMAYTYRFIFMPVGGGSLYGVYGQAMLSILQPLSCACVHAFVAYFDCVGWLSSVFRLLCCRMADGVGLRLEGRLAEIRGLGY